LSKNLSFSRVQAFSTIRDWVLKLGYYKLTAPKEPGLWIFIIDTSIQMGAMKGLLILGVRIDKPLTSGDYHISYCDVQPIVLKPVESCPGEIVEEALREAEKQIGGPAIAVLSDQASELKRGIRLYNEDESKTCHVFDIKHKLDLLVEKEFEKDIVWKSFTAQANQAMQQLKLTSISHLAPPKQRQKDRLLAEFDTVKWGLKLLRFVQCKSDTIPNDQLNKISWITKYEYALIEYLQMSSIGERAIEHVRERGYYKGCCKDFMECFLGNKSTIRAQDFLQKACNIIEEEEKKVPEGMHIPGSSEVIESTFGKFKQLEKANASGGLTSLILSIPAFLGEISEEVVAYAMASTKIETVWDWVKEELGETFWSKKRRDLGELTPASESQVENQLHEAIEVNYLESDEIKLLA